MTQDDSPKPAGEWRERALDAAFQAFMDHAAVPPTGPVLRAALANAIAAHEGAKPIPDAEGLIDQLRDIAEDTAREAGCAIKHTVEWQAADALTAANEREQQWRTWGVIEIAIRNPNVKSYMEHWEGRAEKAERELKLLQGKQPRDFDDQLDERPTITGKGHALVPYLKVQEARREALQMARNIAHNHGQYSMAYVENEPPPDVVTHNRACWAIRDAIDAMIRVLADKPQPPKGDER